MVCFKKKKTFKKLIFTFVLNKFFIYIFVLYCLGMLMLKIKIKNKNKNIILRYFHAKKHFEK